MSDLNDMLGGMGEGSYTPEVKKGAPQIDAPELDDLLAAPTTWNPDTQEKKGAPVVDEPVLLDDPVPAWNQEKKGAPVVEEPVLLDDPMSYASTEAPKKEALPTADTLAADILGDDTAAYDPVEEFYSKLKFTDDLKQAFSGLDAEKQMQVVEMRAKQMGIPTPQIPRELRPVLEAPKPAADDAEPAADAVVLEEAPKPQAYVPKFKDEDLERAKEEAKKPKSYTPPPPQEQTPEQLRESRRIMNELREQREKEAAQKGFKQIILLAILGVVCAAAFTIFMSGAFGLGYKMEDELGWMSYIKDYALYIGVLVGAGSLALFIPHPAVKSLMRFVNAITCILMLFPGIPLLIQKDGSGVVNGILFGVALLLSGFACVKLTTSDEINMYYKHGK